MSNTTVFRRDIPDIPLGEKTEKLFGDRKKIIDELHKYERENVQHREYRTGVYAADSPVTTVALVKADDDFAQAVKDAVKAGKTVMPKLADFVGPAEQGRAEYKTVTDAYRQNLEEKDQEVAETILAERPALMLEQGQKIAQARAEYEKAQAIIGRATAVFQAACEGYVWLASGGEMISPPNYGFVRSVELADWQPEPDGRMTLEAANRTRMARLIVGSEIAEDVLALTPEDRGVIAEYRR